MLVQVENIKHLNAYHDCSHTPNVIFLMLKAAHVMFSFSLLAEAILAGPTPTNFISTALSFSVASLWSIWRLGTVFADPLSRFSSRPKLSCGSSPMLCPRALVVETSAMLFLPQGQLLWIPIASRLTIFHYLCRFILGTTFLVYTKRFLSSLPCCVQLYPSLVTTIDLVSTDSLGDAPSGHLGFLKDT